ncbi:MAG: TPM domain-containing protein [Bacteroidota bacterium]
MKYLLIFLIISLPFFARAQQYPSKPANYITDEAGVISEGNEIALNKKLHRFEDSTSNQIFIYTAASLNGQNLEDFSENLFRAWKIGQKGKNNGVLIAIFVDDHKFRIHTGYGLEGALPDLLTKKIQDGDMRTYFKANRYYEGIDKGVDQLIYYSAHEYTPDDNQESPWGLFAFFYSASALFLLITILLAKKIKDRPTAKKVLILIAVVLFLIPIIGTFLSLIFIFVTVSFRKDLLRPGSGSTGDGYYDSSSSWSSSSYSSSDSSSSSDFGGGGGGDSGGGGSSSDW